MITPDYYLTPLMLYPDTRRDLETNESLAYDSLKFQFDSCCNQHILEGA
jgi:hypothetical protein